MTELLGGKTLLVGLGDVGMGYDLDHNSQSASRSRERESVQTHARAITASPDMRLIGAVDLDPERRRIFESEYNLPTWSSVKAVTAVGVETAVIATSTSQHLDVALDVLKKWHPRLLICEKPFGSNAAEAAQIIEMAGDSNTMIAVNYFRPHLPAFIEIAERLRRSNVGDLKGGSVIYSHGLRRNGCHLVDLVLWLLGECSLSEFATPTREAGRDNYNFVLRSGEADIQFRSLGDPKVRSAEIFLGFDRGNLRMSLGGQFLEVWSDVDSSADGKPLYPELVVRLQQDLNDSQFSFYRWLTDGNLAEDEVTSARERALRTQILIDEVIYLAPR